MKKTKIYLVILACATLVFFAGSVIAGVKIDTTKPSAKISTLNKGLVLDMPLRPGSEKVGNNFITSGYNGETTSGWSSPSQPTYGTFSSGASGGSGFSGNVLKYIASATYTAHRFWASSGGQSEQFANGSSYRIQFKYRSSKTLLLMNRDTTIQSFAANTSSATAISVDYSPTNITWDSAWILFRFDGVSGDYMEIDDIKVVRLQSADTTPNSNHGTIYGADVRNHGASFNGSSNYVDCGYNTNLNITDALTISIWMKGTGTAVIKGGEPETYSMGVRSSKPFFYRELQDGTNEYLNAATSIDTTKWHHLVVIDDNTNMKIFIDGVQDSNTLSSSSWSAGTDTSHLFIGHGAVYGSEAAAAGYLSGSISDVKIYSRALSASEVLDLYQGKEVPGAILDMPLSDKTGFKDISGNGNNGTNNGALIIGEATSFDGTDDRILRNSGGFLPTGDNPRTIVFWFKPNAGMGTANGAFGYGCSTEGYGCGSAGVGRYVGAWANTSNIGIHLETCQVTGPSTPSPTTNWHFYTAVFNGNNTISYYIDSIGPTTVTPGCTINTYAGNGFSIGVGRWGYYNGLISDVQIYNRALSATEIASLYAKGRSTAASAGITTGSLNKGLILDMPLKSKYGRTEETTNLSYLVDNDLNWYTNWNNSGTATWNANDTAISPPDLPGKENYKIVSMRKDTDGNSHLGVGRADITTSTVYTVSVYIYLDTVDSPSGNQPYIRPQPNNGNSGNLYYGQVTNWAQWPKRQWIRISRTFTSPATDATYLYISSYLNTAGDKIYYFAPQVEQKDHLTPFTGPARLNQISDLSPNSNHGSIYGATVGSNYTTFNGSSNYLDLGSSSNLDVNNEITVSTWVKITGSTGDYQEIICRGVKHHYSLIREGTGANGAFSWSMYVNGVRQVLYGGSTYSAGNWYHVVGTYNARTGESKRYVNGVLDASGTLATGTFDSGGTLVIGQNGGSAKWFYGSIANVKIYNRVLSPAEVKSLFDKERSQFGI